MINDDAIFKMKLTKIKFVWTNAFDWNLELMLLMRNCSLIYANYDSFDSINFKFVYNILMYDSSKKVVKLKSKFKIKIVFFSIFWIKSKIAKHQKSELNKNFE